MNEATENEPTSTDSPAKKSFFNIFKKKKQTYRGNKVVDFSIEIDFVKKHIKKEYQERIIFELQSKKNREKAISRFSHSSDMILKDQFVKCTMAELQNHLADSCGVKEECYMISEDMLDGQILPLHDAVEYCLTSYLAVILISSKFAVVKEEAECSEPRIFISK